MKIKWCIIGAGGIADRRTIPAILKSGKNELVGVMDRVPSTAESIGKKYGVAYFSAEEAMLKLCDCDAVYIGTPVACHYEQAMTALRFDKHVFFEEADYGVRRRGKKTRFRFSNCGEAYYGRVYDEAS